MPHVGIAHRGRISGQVGRASTFRAVRFCQSAHAENDARQFERRRVCVRRRVRAQQDGNARWNIVANSGKISDFKESDETSTQAIELFEDVEVYNLDEHGNRIVLSTEYLTLDTQLETLATSELVKLVTDSVQLSSFGMFADLKLDEIVFLRDIRGHYEQPKIQD